MHKIYSIYDEDQDEVLASFTKRELAFEIMKVKAKSQTWRTFTVKESDIYDDEDQLEPILYYRASCGIADAQIDVVEETYFACIEDVPEGDAGEVTISGSNLTCAGRDLEKVVTKIRKFIANKRYEFEQAVRKVCDVVQPKIENNEAMTINQIVDESHVDQDSVVKILLLLKKEGFLEIVDPLEVQKQSEQQASQISRQSQKKGLYLPQGHGAKGAYQQSSGLTNIGFDKKGRLRKKNPKQPGHYISGGYQANIPILKKKP